MLYQIKRYTQWYAYVYMWLLRQEISNLYLINTDLCENKSLMECVVRNIMLGIGIFQSKLKSVSPPDANSFVDLILVYIVNASCVRNA